MKNLSEKNVNEGNQIDYFISSSGSGTIINYGSGSDLLTSYGSGSDSKKVTVPTVPVQGSTTLSVQVVLNGTFGIHAATIGDDPHPLPLDLGEVRPNRLHKVGGVAQLRILRPAKIAMLTISQKKLKKRHLMPQSPPQSWGCSPAAHSSTCKYCIASKFSKKRLKKETSSARSKQIMGLCYLFPSHAFCFFV